MAGRLKLELLAEGVETEAQRRFLESAGIALRYRWIPESSGVEAV